MKLTGFAKYAWSVLGINITVILWGAYVRATGSGAGCGSHWPLCHGEAIPRSPGIETIIEYAHRLSSGLALLAVVLMFIWARRTFAAGDAVRTGATLSLIFIISEALVGAGLVLFEWVAFDDSIERVISMAVHLVNTFLLLAALTLTGWWASGGRWLRIAGSGAIGWFLGVAFIGVLLLGVSGAITALGDTLFPSESLASGIQQDFSPTAHFLIRLRVWHPLLAILIGTYVIILAIGISLHSSDRTQRRLAVGLCLVVAGQLFAGLINLVLLAPVWMQILHLLLADLLWILLVGFAASTLSKETGSTTVEIPNRADPLLSSSDPAGILS